MEHIRVDVIGGAGFIGTRLIRRLNSRFRPLVIDKNSPKSSNVAFELANVLDVDKLCSVVSADILINLAAEHRDDVSPRSLYDEVNVQGARNIVQAAEFNGVEKIIFTSSVAVYGFAPIGTDETGKFMPFNDYGRTKLAAEYVYKEWQKKDPDNRTLVIIRPTVVFGEANRGNVYNLLRQIASGKFFMVGKGTNVKSMAYVENIVAFIEHSLSFGSGVHVYNYVDKPDFDINTLVGTVHRVLGKEPSKLRLPYSAGLVIGKCFDVLAAVTDKKFPVSSIRIKKFCSDTMFSTSVGDTNFVPPVKLRDALERTVRYEFVDDNEGREVFYTE